MDFRVEIARAEWRAQKMRELAALFEDKDTRELAREMLAPPAKSHRLMPRTAQGVGTRGMVVAALAKTSMTQLDLVAALRGAITTRSPDPSKVLRNTVIQLRREGLVSRDENGVLSVSFSVAKNDQSNEEG